MKALFTFIFLLVIGVTYAQINPGLNALVLNVTAEVQENPASITLHWSNSTATGSGFAIHRRQGNISIWSSVASPSLTDSTFTDTGISEGIQYEYRISKLSGGQAVSWGYIASGINVLPKLINRGLLLVKDTSITNRFQFKIDFWKENLEADGYFVQEIEVDRNDAVTDVKAKIVAAYNAGTINYTSAIILGHVPVPYSGDLYPDAHTDHKGAWPTDLFYADIDGNWTDVTVNNTDGSDPRTDNVPGDGKYDQSTVPSALELEIGRIDFHSMSWFGESELELLEAYIDKNIDFRRKKFVPGRKGLMDEGGFATRAAAEGFGQSAPRAMVPLVGRDSLILGDYFGTLENESHLFSYGQGGGSYTSCGGVGTTRDFDSIAVQSVFTMLFGSYFGDYDKANNLMRASLGSGTVLTCSWSSARPIWYYHHMAMGTPVGFSANRSLNVGNEYFFINFGAQFPTNQGVHNVLLGDPTLRAFYTAPTTRMAAVSDPIGTGNVTIQWPPSPDPGLIGYNLYRTETGTFNYVKVNQSPIPTEIYIDSLGSGSYQYFLRAVSLETTASGSYYNESLGVFTGVDVRNTVNNEPLLDQSSINIYPNPAQNSLFIDTELQITNMEILDMKGSMLAEYSSTNKLDISSLSAGVYALRFRTARGVLVRMFVKE
ncbi:MAG: T9SS type A sorting domain-containing protein [Bacteroidia bacterium]